MRGPLLARLEGSTVSVMEWGARGGVNSPRGIYQILRLARFLRRGHFDIVHAHDLWSKPPGDSGCAAGACAGDYFQPSRSRSSCLVHAAAAKNPVATCNRFRRRCW